MRRRPFQLVSFATLLSSSALLVPLVLGSASCAAEKSSPVATCQVGADCVSGICGSDGLCVPVEDAHPDVTSDVAQEASPDALGDTGGETSPGDAKTDSPVDTAGGCTPNGDYVITPAELPLGPGLKATYKLASSTSGVTVDTAGTAQADGTRVWDYTGAIAGDKNVLVETVSPTGAWWASSFPTASYSVFLATDSTAGDLYAVFKIDAAALSLQGVVSPADGTTSTKVTYATPIPVTKLPLQMGASWTATSSVSGTYAGIFTTYSETYDVKVDAKGTVKTPFGDFKVLRVSTLLSKTVGLSTTKTRTYGFMAECFGTVASVRSTTPTFGTDPGENFGSAAEVRRLAP
jgi:hypothetical protein